MSDFLDEIKYTESIQNGLASMLDEYNTKKEELKNKNVELAQKKIDLENQKVTLEDEKDNLINEQQRLALLISQTNDEEKKFQDMMNKAIADQKAMEQEIEDLQKEILDNNIKFADAKRKEDIEKEIGTKLEWVEAEKDCRIILRHDGDIKKGEESWTPIFQWFMNTCFILRDVAKKFGV